MSKPLVLVIGLLSVLAACGDSDEATDSQFCEQAQYFASESTRDADTDYDRSEAGYLAALTNLRDLAPASLRADLDLLVASERDRNAESETTDAAVASAGARVGNAIEARCQLQLPGVRSQ